MTLKIPLKIPITNALTHSNIYHLLLNLTGLGLVWALYGPNIKQLLGLGSFIFCCITTGTGLYYFTRYNYYWGMSGALYGLLLLGAIAASRQKDKTAWVIIIYVVGRIGWENLTGASSEVEDLLETKVAVESHLWGCIGIAATFWKQLGNGDQTKSEE